MIRAGETAQHMRSNQTYEPDGTADGYADPDKNADADQHRQFYAADIDAHVAGIVLSDGESVEFPGTAQQDCSSYDKRDIQQGGVLVAAALKGAQRPEHDALHLFAGESDDKTGDAAREHGEDDPQQDDGVGGKR